MINQVTLPFYIVCSIFLSLYHFFISHTTGPTNHHSSPAPYFKIVLEFLSTLWSVQIWAPYKATLKLQHFTIIFLKRKSQLLVKKSFLLVESCLFHGNPGFYFPCTPSIICYRVTQAVEIFHILQMILSTIISIGEGCLEILIALVFSHVDFQSVIFSNFNWSFYHGL